MNLDSAKKTRSTDFTNPRLHPGDFVPTQRVVRRLSSEDLEPLHEYLLGLSEATKRRFGPHPFEREALVELFSHPGDFSGYVALDSGTNKIIAYSIIKKGFLEHDRPRLENHGLCLDPLTDATFAPSVADEWQGLGVGPQLFHFMIPCLKAERVKRILLWGGVQCENLKA